MADAVQVYIDHVVSIREKGYILERVEHTLGGEDFGGTVDHYLIDRDGVAWVNDYKHGAGVAVEVKDNKQLLSYCLLIHDHYPGCIESFIVAIVQPRAFNHVSISSVEVSLDEVEEHRRAILAATGDDLHVGDHCRWCNKLVNCPAMRAETLRVAANEFDDNDIAELVRLAGLSASIKSLLDQVPLAMLRLMQLGHSIPGYKIVQSQSNRRWSKSTEEVLAELGLDPNVATERKLKSPAQLERLGADKKRIASLTYRADLGTKVVPQSATGEAVKAYEEFE